MVLSPDAKKVLDGIPVVPGKPKTAAHFQSANRWTTERTSDAFDELVDAGFIWTPGAWPVCCADPYWATAEGSEARGW